MPMASPAHAKGQHGTFVTLDVGGEFLILPAGISLAGTVTGTYYELINQNLVSFGFLRAPNGNFTTIDSPGSAALGAAVINRPGWSREATSIQMVQRSTASCATVPVGWTASGENKLRLVAG